MTTVVFVDRKGNPRVRQFEDDGVASEWIAEDYLFEFEPMFGMGLVQLRRLGLKKLIDLNNEAYRTECFVRPNDPRAEHIAIQAKKKYAEFLGISDGVIIPFEPFTVCFKVEGLIVEMDSPLVRAVFALLAKSRDAINAWDVGINVSNVKTEGKNDTPPMRVKNHKDSDVSERMAVWFLYEEGELEVIIRKRDSHEQWFCPGKDVLRQLFSHCDNFWKNLTIKTEKNPPIKMDKKVQNIGG